MKNQLTTFDNDAKVRWVNSKISEKLSLERQDHCRRVAVYCQRLCKAHGLSEYKGYLCGLAHDLRKETKKKKILKKVEKHLEWWQCLTDYAIEKPRRLHGFAAAIKLRKKFGIDDEMFEAIKFHSKGCVGMGELTKCLIIADKVEKYGYKIEEYLHMDLDKAVRSLLGSKLCQERDPFVRNRFAVAA